MKWYHKRWIFNRHLVELISEFIFLFIVFIYYDTWIAKLYLLSYLALEFIQIYLDKIAVIVKADHRRIKDLHDRMKKAADRS